MRIQPWNLVYLIGLMVNVCIRAVFQRRTRRNEQAVSRAGALDKTLSCIVMPVGLLLPVVYLFTPWLAFADYHLPVFVPWCGAVLMVLALWLFYRSHADLGLNWSFRLELRKGHQLVKQGIYGSIRHPMYASIWLWCLAQGLLLENWLAGWYAALAFALTYSVRAPREEQMMCETFGREYRDYMRQTGRLFPRIHIKNDA